MSLRRLWYLVALSVLIVLCSKNGLAQDTYQAAEEAGILAEIISGGVGMDGRSEMQSEVCSMGAESYLPLSVTGDPTTMFQRARGGDACNPNSFANIICRTDLYNHMGRRTRDPGSRGFLTSVFYSLGQEDDGSEVNCAGSWNGFSTRKRTYCNLVRTSYDPQADTCPNDPDTLASCTRSRDTLRRLALRESTNPRFMDRFLSGSAAQASLRAASQELELLRSHMKAALWNSYCPNSTRITEVNSDTFLEDNQCNLPGAGTQAPNVFLRRMFESIDRATIELPNPRACIGDDTNTIVTRRADGSPQIYLCPRALMQAGAVGRLTMRSALAAALGHAVDSCALEMQQAGEPAMSMARLTDGLRACLVENGLRTPPLSIRATTARRRGAAAAIPTYTPAWLGAEMSASRETTLGLGDSEAPRHSHCGGFVSPSGRAVGVDELSRQENPANALEAQYWANQTLGLAFQEEGQSLETHQSDLDDWSAHCRSLPAAADQRVCASAVGPNATERRFFRLRMMYQPYCRGLAGGGMEPQTARALFNVINHDPAVRRLMRCRESTDRMVTEVIIPTPVPAGRRELQLNYGYCGPQLLSDQLTALTNGQGTRPTRMPSRPTEAYAAASRTAGGAHTSSAPQPELQPQTQTQLTTATTSATVRPQAFPTTGPGRFALTPVTSAAAAEQAAMFDNAGTYLALERTEQHNGQTYRIAEYNFIGQAVGADGNRQTTDRLVERRYYNAQGQLVRAEIANANGEWLAFEGEALHSPHIRDLMATRDLLLCRTDSLRAGCADILAAADDRDRQVEASRQPAEESPGDAPQTGGAVGGSSSNPATAPTPSTAPVRPAEPVPVPLPEDSEARVEEPEPVEAAAKAVMHQSRPVQAAGAAAEPSPSTTDPAQSKSLALQLGDPRPTPEMFRVGPEYLSRTRRDGIRRIGASPLARRLTQDVDVVAGKFGDEIYNASRSPTCAGAGSSCGRPVQISSYGRVLRQFPTREAATRAGCPGNMPCRCVTTFDSRTGAFRCDRPESGRTAFGLTEPIPASQATYVVRVPREFARELTDSRGRIEYDHRDIAYPVGMLVPPRLAKGRAPASGPVVLAPEVCLYEDNSTGCEFSMFYVLEPGQREPRRIRESELDSIRLYQGFQAR